MRRHTYALCVIRDILADWKPVPIIRTRRCEQMRITKWTAESVTEPSQHKCRSTKHILKPQKIMYSGFTYLTLLSIAGQQRRMIGRSVKMYWKGYGIKRSWPNLRHALLSWHLSGRTEGPTTHLSEDSWSSGRDLEQGPPKYEAGMKCRRLWQIHRERGKTSSVFPLLHSACGSLEYLIVKDSFIGVLYTLE
jgi:hypothetical protein